jgi:hypothetical protein
MKKLDSNACGQLVPARSIYVREADTPPGTWLKRYRDGRCDLVSFDRQSAPKS